MEQGKGLDCSCHPFCSDGQHGGRPAALGEEVGVSGIGKGQEKDGAIWIIGKSGKEQERPWCGPGEANIRTSFCLRDEISIKGAVYIVGESIQ